MYIYFPWTWIQRPGINEWIEQNIQKTTDSDYSTILPGHCIQVGTCDWRLTVPFRIYTLSYI